MTIVNQYGLTVAKDLPLVRNVSGKASYVSSQVYLTEFSNEAHVDLITDLLTSSWDASNRILFYDAKNATFSASTQFLNKLGEGVRDSIITEHPELDKNNLAEITPGYIQKATVPQTTALTVPLQTFEGKVISVLQNGSMLTILSDKTGNLQDHEATISLEWVQQQDQDLVKPGAVFYLSLYKETRRGTIRNSEEIRFRRLPNWTQQQIDSSNQRAGALLAKFKVKPIATDID